MKRSIVVVLVLAFFAAATSPVPAQWANSPEIKALYAAAKAESEVIVWVPSKRAVAWIPRAFAQMFPDVAVKPYAASDIANRAMLDARSSQFGVDALWLEFPAAAPVMRRDLVAAIDWQQFGVGAGNLAFDGRMAFTNNIIYVVAYNAAQVKDSDVPGSWQDLLDDKYQGRMVASLYQLPQLIGGLAQEWGSDRSLQFARDLLVRSGILMTRAPRDAYLKSGDRPSRSARSTPCRGYGPPTGSPSATRCWSPSWRTSSVSWSCPTRRIPTPRGCWPAGSRRARASARASAPPARSTTGPAPTTRSPAGCRPRASSSSTRARTGPRTAKPSSPADRDPVVDAALSAQRGR